MTNVSNEQRGRLLKVIGLTAGVLALTTVGVSAAEIVPGGQGCSPGYWKNHTNQWHEPITTTTTLSPTFNTELFLNLEKKTFLEALNFGGGPSLSDKAKILLKQGVAGILNTEVVSYPLTAQQLISDVNTALLSGIPESMTNEAVILDQYNNLGAPLCTSTGIELKSLTAKSGDQGFWNFAKLVKPANIHSLFGFR
jgi:hypothetical protein